MPATHTLFCGTIPCWRRHTVAAPRPRVPFRAAAPVCRLPLRAFPVAGAWTVPPAALLTARPCALVALLPALPACCHGCLRTPAHPRLASCFLLALTRCHHGVLRPSYTMPSRPSCTPAIFPLPAPAASPPCCDDPVSVTKPRAEEHSTAQHSRAEQSTAQRSTACREAACGRQRAGHAGLQRRIMQWLAQQGAATRRTAAGAPRAPRQGVCQGEGTVWLLAYESYCWRSAISACGFGGAKHGRVSEARCVQQLHRHSRAAPAQRLRTRHARPAAAPPPNLRFPSSLHACSTSPAPRRQPPPTNINFHACMPRHTPQRPPPPTQPPTSDFHDACVLCPRSRLSFSLSFRSCLQKRKQTHGKASEARQGTRPAGGGAARPPPKPPQALSHPLTACAAAARRPPPSPGIRRRPWAWWACPWGRGACRARGRRVRPCRRPLRRPQCHHPLRAHPASQSARRARAIGRRRQRAVARASGVGVRAGHGSQPLFLASSPHAADGAHPLGDTVLSTQHTYPIGFPLLPSLILDPFMTHP